jgi:hypothetical protein
MLPTWRPGHWPAAGERPGRYDRYSDLRTASLACSTLNYGGQQQAVLAGYVGQKLKFQADFTCLRW